MKYLSLIGQRLEFFNYYLQISEMNHLKLKSSSVSVLSTIQESPLEDQYLSLAEELKEERRKSEEGITENRILRNDLSSVNEKIATLERNLADALNESSVLSSDNTKLKEKNFWLEIELSQSTETVAQLESHYFSLSDRFNQLQDERVEVLSELKEHLDNLERTYNLLRNTYESELLEQDEKIIELKNILREKKQELKQKLAKAVEQEISYNRILRNDLKSVHEKIATLERKLAGALNKSFVLSWHNTKLKEENSWLKIELCQLKETVAVLEVHQAIIQDEKEEKDRHERRSKSKLKSYFQNLFGCFCRKRNKI